jgi:hypothetical protein
MPIAAKQLDSSQQITIPLAINAETNLGGYTVVGGDEFDPSILPSSNRTIEFVARLLTTNAANDGYVRLYNVTDGAAIAGTELTTNSLSADRLSVILSVPVDLPNAEKTYEVQLRISPADGNLVRCLKSEIKIRWI